jgi:Flp pilus assembly protein TadG
LRERGAALIELAIALPILVLIVFGVVEFGFTCTSGSRGTIYLNSGTLDLRGNGSCHSRTP